MPQGKGELPGGPGREGLSGNLPGGGRHWNVPPPPAPPFREQPQRHRKTTPMLTEKTAPENRDACTFLSSCPSLWEDLFKVKKKERKTEVSMKGGRREGGREGSKERERAKPSVLAVPSLVLLSASPGRQVAGKHHREPLRARSGAE